MKAMLPLLLAGMLLLAGCVSQSGQPPVQQPAVNATVDAGLQESSSTIQELGDVDTQNLDAINELDDTTIDETTFQ